MLQIKDLNIYLREDDRLILSDFSFSLNQGDKVGLIGEEGNGKSILLKAIINREEVEKYCDVKGHISTNNEIIGYLPQNLDDRYFDYTTYEYLNKKIYPLDIDYNLLYKLISEFDLRYDILEDNIKLKFLSGGEKIKFLFLVEMMKSPTVFLFDEPSNDLDLDSVIWLEKFMKETEIPFIFVSHDSMLLSNIANKIIHLEQTQRRTIAKHTVSNNSYMEYVNKRSQYIESQTNRSRKEHEEFSKKMVRYRRVHDAVESSLRATRGNNPGAGKNLKDKMHTVKAMGKRLEKEKENLTKEPDYEEAIGILFDSDIEVPNGKVILDFNLDELKAGEKILSKNIKLKIIGPEKICIMGRNGVGKTTLVKILIKELENLNLRVGYMPQQYFDFERDNITAIDYLSKTFKKDEHTKISLYLGSLNFKREEMYRNIKDLSGGQKAKLFFAKMNLDKAQVLVLDEPTRNLSPLSQPEIIQALQDYKGVIIAISHDRDFIDQVFDTIYELKEDGLELRH